MWTYYVIALTPVIVGAALWLSSRRITASEWMRGALLGFLIAGAFHLYTVLSLTLDYETRSGKAIQVAHCPDTYIESGDETRFLPEHWTVTIDLGQDLDCFEIPQEEFETLGARFGGEASEERPWNFTAIDDDYRVRVIRNESDVLVPGHSFRMSKRSMQSGPSVLAFQDPPDDLPLHEYPTGMTATETSMFVAGETALHWTGERTIPIDAQFFDWRRSERLLGTAAKDFSIEAWDALSATAALAVGANLIAIGFDGDSSLAHWQEAKWRGGKRNDLVLCYGPLGPAGEPAWTYCFGWSEDELVRRNLETLLLSSTPSNSLAPAIEAEVVANYRPRTWPDVDLMQIPAPAGSLIRLVLFMIFIQGGYWCVAYRNRSRRRAADAEEDAEEKEERLHAHRLERDRADRKRVREQLPHLDPDDVDALIAEVLNHDKNAYLACFGLRHLDDPRATTGLVIGVTSGSFRARELAGRWLDEHIPDPSASIEAHAAIPALIERLAHRSRAIRREARRILDGMRPDWADSPEARGDVPHLIAELDRIDPERGAPERASMDALAARSSEVMEPLLSRLESGDRAMPRRVLPVLGATRDPRAVAPLLDHLNSSDAGLARAALEGLGRYGQGLAHHDAAELLWEALDPVVTAIDMRDKDLSLAGILALASLHDSRGNRHLLPHLRGTDPARRIAAIDALAVDPADPTLELLVGRLAQSESRETLALVRALGSSRSREIVPPLSNLFRNRVDGGSLLLETIIHALFPLGGPDVEALLQRAADDPHSAVGDLAELRLRQLRAGFRPPGWDLTATGWRDQLSETTERARVTPASS